MDAVPCILKDRGEREGGEREDGMSGRRGERERDRTRERVEEL